MKQDYFVYNSSAKRLTFAVATFIIYLKLTNYRLLFDDLYYIFTVFQGRRREMRRRYIAFALCIIFAYSIIFGGFSEFKVYGIELNEIEQTHSLSPGVQNIVKRADQMLNIQWTPLENVDGWNSEITYFAGKTYTGLPYGQPVYARYVPWSATLEEFLGAVNTPNSKMYTDYSEYNCRAPYYSIDCSAFVSWAWGLGSRQTTSTIKNFATQISTSSYANAQVGDCLCLAGSHVVLITDITYDSNGSINGIEISESTVNAATNYCCQQTRYGAGGSYSLAYLSSKYFGNGYILYRSNTRDIVTYAHSCAVPLEGDVCSDCGLGDYIEIAYDVVVVCSQNVTLYAMPNHSADQIGTIYTGSEIVVTAYCEDDSGILWYKTSDGEWILAEQTVPVCEHGVCGSCGAKDEGYVDKFEISFANMTLGNSLAMNFAFEQGHRDDWTGCYAKIVKEYADGRPNKEITIPYAQWGSAGINGVKHFALKFDGVAAKEMSDNVFVTIYDAQGNAISYTWEDSVRGYAMRTLNNPKTSRESAIMVVDLLNYGAAAQSYFKYNTGDQANNQMTEAQKALATKDAPAEDIRVKGPNYLGTNLGLESQILMRMAFVNTTEDMNATIEFTNHAGREIKVELDGSEFGASGVFVIDEIVIADGRRPVTVTIYNADGSIFASATDSMESYIARMRRDKYDPLYEAILKFSDSAYNFFH